jgi:hypothetical protein
MDYRLSRLRGLNGTPGTRGQSDRVDRDPPRSLGGQGDFAGSPSTILESAWRKPYTGAWTWDTSCERSESHARISIQVGIGATQLRAGVAVDGSRPCRRGSRANPFAEIGLRIKERSSFVFTFLAGNSNRHLGYAPTADAYGSEAYEDTLTGFAPEWQAPNEAKALEVLGRLKGASDSD